jgi:hypothetical protein
MRRLLKLQPHKHSGKLIHHRHTSFRALALLVAVTGMVVGWAAWTLRQTAMADSLLVNAKVAAVIPSQPAFINTPADGSTSSTSIITLDGTCQVTIPGAIVVIMRGGSQLGSVSCDSGGAFSLSVTLVAGNNQLLPRTVNITGDYGPDGTPVNIIYTPPTPPLTGSGTTPGQPTTTPPATTDDSDNGTATSTPSDQSALVPQITLSTQQPFLIFGPNQQAVLGMTIDRGRAPYTVHVNWGDNTSDTYHNVSGGSLQQFKHQYTVMKSYRVIFDVTDSDGKTTSQSIAAVTPALSYAPAITGIGSTNGGLSMRTLLLISAGYAGLAAGFTAWWFYAHRLALHGARSTLQVRHLRGKPPRRR